MASISNPQPEPTAGDELVAYLDGELAPEDCRRIENRLAADADYRQQLRDLDQAWEALNALPKTSVDDNFARTTIELACVDAEKDLSQRTAQTSAETRTWAWRWIAAGVAAALLGFLVTKAIVVHRDNAILADLPVIEQVNALTHVENIEFLRQLSNRIQPEQLAKDEVAFDRELDEFKRASSKTLEARREWVKALTPEQKADLANQASMFDHLRQPPHEKNRLRKLAAEINNAPDAPELQKTLVAYGQWLSRRAPGEKEQLRQDILGQPPERQVALIQKTVRREEEQASRHLSPDDAKALREEILRFADEKKADFLARFPRGRDGNRPPNLEGPPARQALWILHLALQNNETKEATAQRLVDQLSPEQKAHWKRMGRWRPDLRIGQLTMWVRDAMQPKWGPDDLENFFVSGKLNDDERARLLDMSRPEMQAKLEQLYLSSELGIEDRSQWPREFVEPGRMQKNLPGGGIGGPPGDFPPVDKRGGPAGLPPNRFDRDRPPGPDGFRGPRRDDRPEDGRPGKRPRRPPGDPPVGPPPQPGQPREAI